MQLLEELYKNKIIDEQRKSELQFELEKTGQPEEEIILKHKVMPEDALFKLKSNLVKVPFLKPDTEEIPLDILELIPQEAAVNYKMTPLSRKGDVVSIGMVYPENTLAHNALRFLSRKENFTYEVYLITVSDLNNILKQHSNLKTETKRALTELSKEKGVISQDSKDSLSGSIGDDAPIIKMVMVILRHAIEGNASDIHIEPSRERLNVRFRQDGVLHLSLFLPLSVHLSIVSRIKILANLKIDENRLPQDGRFSSKINNKDIDFRVATFPTLYGEKVEIRVL